METQPFYVSDNLVELSRMNSDSSDGVNPLVEFKKGEFEKHAAYDVLADVRSANVWLANFSSRNTRDSYKRSVGSG